ncbi:efflux RND transporter periplasmic adaptor subunit [Mucilaginibacter sp. UR6-11]|uniref:efflux RND transporter periplasmic adaptor subunit n=1 Tax=Mucilaginibacter sp. UR6-11 TaxID=1435644 RepID=UPI001E2BA8B3|nr:efflux RND transporter periplasmic adaptor subunit [Mucilaginibacter sp. UR6-11]MCC8425638.1 efflux RND transporter periplasmic adaptor subunit [Mucilaginibacter sp. UR6-11]
MKKILLALISITGCSALFRGVPLCSAHSKWNTVKLLSVASVLSLVILLASCKGSTTPADETATPEVQTPVSVTTVNDSTLVDYTTLNATSTFQKRSVIKANANGYLQTVRAQIGQYINKGAVIFSIKTKEAQSIGNTINILDTSFKFSGINHIKAADHGYITQLNHQTGDYVQDGEQLAVISDRSSFVFIMQLPYEMRQSVKTNQTVQLTLPDGRLINGNIASFMPAVDTASQTQGVVIRVNADSSIPENLVAKARIVKSLKQNTQSLPKGAVLANETQTEFWVMKLINPTTAVKTPIKKGMESGDQIEVLSPKFSPQDKIVVTGNYGLADTAKVKVIK